MKHINIPVFVPHLGCPHTCVFCDQRTITGQKDAGPDAVDEAVRRVLPGGHDAGKAEKAEREIAFFGGSFTAIGKERMTAFLDRAEAYVGRGLVSSIRLSTRPDAIDPAILTLLSAYSVKTIELGVQSTDPAVLAASERGHTAADSERAFRLIASRGFTPVGQMMLGLPASDFDAEEKTARDIIAWGAKEVRIYPTVVFAETKLAKAFAAGLYCPLPPDEAAWRAARLLMLFERAGVKVLRIGLCETDGLRSARVVGGAHHPALGELAYNELYRMKIEGLLADIHAGTRNAPEPASALPAKPSASLPDSPPAGPASQKTGASHRPGAQILVECAPRALSRAIGQKKKNLLLLRKRFPDAVVRFAESPALTGYEVQITMKENGKCVFSHSSSTGSSPSRSAPRSPSTRA